MAIEIPPSTVARETGKESYLARVDTLARERVFVGSHCEDVCMCGFVTEKMGLSMGGGG